MTLEELGLLQLLEKISEDAGAAIDGFARFGLAQSGLITDAGALRLTDLGSARLDALRQARDAATEDPDLMVDPDPDPSPA